MTSILPKSNIWLCETTNIKKEDNGGFLYPSSTLVRNVLGYNESELSATSPIS
jgi:hypothetical protein